MNIYFYLISRLLWIGRLLFYCLLYVYFEFIKSLRSSSATNWNRYLELANWMIAKMKYVWAFLSKKKKKTTYKWNKLNFIQTVKSIRTQILNGTRADCLNIKHIKFETIHRTPTFNTLWPVSFKRSHVTK